jgi:hypothetical protein
LPVFVIITLTWLTSEFLLKATSHNTEEVTKPIGFGVQNKIHKVPFGHFLEILISQEVQTHFRKTFLLNSQVLFYCATS